MGDEKRKLTTFEISRDIERGSKFLGTLSRSPEIRRILADRGYTAEEHQTGWNRYLAVMGWRPEPLDDNAFPQLSQDQAIAELDQWDGPNFTIARSALHRLHPEQEFYVFQDLTAQSGAAAVGSVKTYLDRVIALRDGTDKKRSDMREQDQAAVATLEKRRVAGSELEAHLMALIETAKQAAPLPPEGADIDETDEYQEIARKFHDWLTDWRETARVVITRRDYKIRLGLVERRKSSNEEPKKE